MTDTKERCTETDTQAHTWKLHRDVQRQGPRQTQREREGSRSRSRGKIIRGSEPRGSVQREVPPAG